MLGSAMVAVIGLIAEPTVRSMERPTGTDAAAGVTTMGGGVGVAVGTAAGMFDGPTGGDGDGDGVEAEVAV